MTMRLSLCAALLLAGAGCKVISDAQQELRSADYDQDGDGYAGAGYDQSEGVPGEDCDDTNAGVYPGADEGCDGIDTDCDGEPGADEVPGSGYLDEDGDGYGGEPVLRCMEREGLPVVTQDGDCDDTDVLVNPGVTDEGCDGIDTDCDGVVGELEPENMGYVDMDGDGHGDPSRSAPKCEGDYVVDTSDDCDDAQAQVHPGADEGCDGLDTDCDGSMAADEALDSAYLDADGDGYGTTPVRRCLEQSGVGVADQPGDCDDLDAATFPDAAELCDGADNNCDGVLPPNEKGWADLDRDGFGDPSTPAPVCLGGVLDDTDCDDADARVNPAMPELDSDGLDNDCQGGDWRSVIYVTAASVAPDGGRIPNTSRVIALDASDGSYIWESDILKGDNAYALALDSDGRLWVGTTKGLEVFDSPDFADPERFRQASDDSLLPSSPTFVDAGSTVTGVAFWTDAGGQEHLLYSVAGSALVIADVPSSPVPQDFPIPPVAVSGVGTDTMYALTVQSALGQVVGAQRNQFQLQVVTNLESVVATSSAAEVLSIAAPNPRHERTLDAGPWAITLDSRGRTGFGERIYGPWVVDGPGDTPAALLPASPGVLRALCPDPLHEQGTLVALNTGMLRRWDAGAGAPVAFVDLQHDFEPVASWGFTQACVTTLQPDADHDGHTTARLGGDDCDDHDAAVWDCAEVPEPLRDADGDGHYAYGHGGLDCDDSDDLVHPDALDLPYDDIDQDCDGFDNRPPVYITLGIAGEPSTPRMMLSMDALDGRVWWEAFDRDPQGKILMPNMALPLDDGMVWDFAPGPDGELYLSDNSGRRVMRVQPGAGLRDDRLVEVWSTTVSGSPRGISFDPVSQRVVYAMNLSIDAVDPLDGQAFSSTVYGNYSNFADVAWSALDAAWVINVRGSTTTRAFPAGWVADNSMEYAGFSGTGVLAFDLAGRLWGVGNGTWFASSDQSLELAGSIGRTAFDSAKAWCPHPTDPDVMLAWDGTQFQQWNVVTDAVNPMPTSLTGRLALATTGQMEPLRCAAAVPPDADGDGHFSRLVGGDDCDDYDPNSGAGAVCP